MPRRTAPVRAGRSDLFILAALIAAATTVALVLVIVPSSKEFFINETAWEFTTQFLFVAILGGAVALVYRRWETAQATQRSEAQRAAERRAVRRDLLEAFYRTFLNVHQQYKKIRRTLRAFSTGSPRQIRRDVFERLMDGMEDCQLKIEALRREVDVNGGLFGIEKNLIALKLKTMDGFLRALLRGYEDHYGARHALPPTELVTMDGKLHEFVERMGGADVGPSALFAAADAVEEAIIRQMEREIQTLD